MIRHEPSGSIRVLRSTSTFCKGSSACNPTDNKDLKIKLFFVWFLHTLSVRKNIFIIKRPHKKSISVSFKVLLNKEAIGSTIFTGLRKDGAIAWNDWVKRLRPKIKGVPSMESNISFIDIYWPSAQYSKIIVPYWIVLYSFRT